MPGGKDTTMPRHQEILQRAIGAPASGPACSGIIGLMIFGRAGGRRSGIKNEMTNV
jgi:hypothetical protein